MNLTLATGPLAQAVGWALLHLLWQGTLVAALLAVVLSALPGRSANLRYALSCAALVLVVGLGVTTGIREYTHPSTDLHRSTAPLATPAGDGPEAVTVTPRGGSGVDAGVGVAPSPGSWSERLAAVRRVAGDALPFLVTVWLLGVAAFSIRLLVEWLRAQRLVARSVASAPDAWQEAAARLARALGVRRAVRLLESTAVVVPSVVGLVRPAILLPASTLTGLTPAQLEMILAHELAHIRRHDFLVNLLQSIVETLLFYHPAVWWISRQVRDERENCCDDLAVSVCGNPIQYARALTRLEELRGEALPLAASANGGSLFERVRRIAGGPRRPRGLAGRGVAAVSALFCGMLALVTLTAPAIGEWAPAKARTKAKTTAPATATTVVRSASLPPSVGAFAAPSHDFVATVDTEPPPGEATKAGDAVDALEPMDAMNAGEAVAAGESTQGEPSAPAEESAADLERADGKPSLDDLVALRVHGVTPEAIDAMRAIFPRVSLKEIAGMHAVGANADYVRQMRRELTVATPDDASGLAAVGVTPAYLKEIRAAGLDVTTADEAQGLAGVGVTPAFLKDVRAAGLRVDSAEEAQSLAGVGVTGDYVRAIRAAGIPVRSPEEASGLAALGVSPDSIRRMRKAGVDLKTAEDAQGLQAVGVTPEFVERLARAGYANLTVEELQRLGASGVTGDFVREMAKYRR